tara:strand:+ start:417 stop:836 length:420 start_codon:yes stop_codon:yes gene_type:complete
MNIKKNIFGILILGIIGGFAAYKIYNKPHVNVGEASADLSVSADKILKDFILDETRANETYLEKIIEVTGVISDIKKEREKGIIALKTNDDFGTVLAHLSEEATKKISSLKVGKSIVLKGICTGYLMDVILVKSEIINY